MKTRFLFACIVSLAFILLVSGCIPAKISISKNGKIALQLDSKRNYNVFTDSSDSEIYLTDLKGSFIDRLTSNNHYDGWPEFSPDENFLLFVSHSQKKWQLHILKLKDKEDKVIYEDTKEIHNPVFSPNGELIAFFTKSDESIFSLEVFSLSLKKKLSQIENVIPYSLSWSADSRFVFILRGLNCSNVNELVSGYIGTFDVVEGKEKEKITAGFFRNESLTFHTNLNTNKLCFSATNDTSPFDLGNTNKKHWYAVFLINKSGRGLQWISSVDKSAGLATFSPDNNKVMWLQTSKNVDSHWGSLCIYDIQKNSSEIILKDGKYTYPQWVRENVILFVDLQYESPHIIVYDLIEKKKTDVSWKMSEATETTPEDWEEKK